MAPVESKTNEGSKEKKDDTDKKEANVILASSTAVFSSFGRTPKIVLFRTIGAVFSVFAGFVQPAMALYFSESFEKIGSDATGAIIEVLETFLILGACAFFFLVGASFFLEVAASESTADFKKRWFEALLRQDMAYYDIKDVSSQATVVAAQSLKYKRGTGRKFGEGIQYLFTVLGGFAVGFYLSWRVSLIVLAAVPLMAGTAAFVMTVTTKQTERKNLGYAETGGIVYSTISSIRTVFALNACETMIENFKNATQRACDSAISFTYLVGFGNGAMMGSFLVAYILVTIYGGYLLYSEVSKKGCDPSNMLGVASCNTIGTEIFGALFGVVIGAMGLAQLSAAFEAFTGARSAAYPALEAINRTTENAALINVEDVETPAESTTEKRTEIPLPKYVIDSSSDDGLKPKSVDGNIVFSNVSFSYPTRPDQLVFDGFSLNIESGKTVALVGPSGSGKSTTVSLLERFYDPTAGSISLDGNDLRNINVGWLRDNIGLVSQEPVLFARTIRENISYGMPTATEHDIITVAKAANAHDFISNFPAGYDTQVGDKGAQLSGGQKQRIAIARILLKNPKILLLDEATSALDSESEYVVQGALDNVLGGGNRTTVVIAHRLSTIRNADVIAVVKEGKIVEQGTHDSLLARKDSEYRKLVEAQAPTKPMTPSSSSGALNDQHSVISDIGQTPQIRFRDVHFSYPSRPTNEIFTGLNLSIRSGETLAIVGPSGGGKSTVVQMIERFYDPIHGLIEYEGRDITTLNVKWYRDQLGFVSQEPTLFNTTILENIRYGLPGATDEQVKAAAKKANAHDFITSFPNGYDTDVGENATQVSGGQKQRIAIARALIKEPKILLLDEATSALDTESERVVQSAIDSLMVSKNQTIVVIAHRLSTIRNSDRIAVIAGGVLKEIGSHDELIDKRNGHYKRLVEFAGLERHEGVSKKTVEEDDDLLIDTSVHGDDAEEDKGKVKTNTKRARSFVAPGDYWLFFVGGIGATLAGLVFPGWGVVFAYMVDFLYHPVFPCTEDSFASDTASAVDNYGYDPYVGYESCADYQQANADWLENMSYDISYGWAVLIASTILGNILLFYGFGTATERMNKRVRDSIFVALMRQDVGYYDTHSVGRLSTQIEDDAAMLHAFSGEPIRQAVMAIASVVVGVILCFVYMWHFALMFLATLPFMAFGAHMEMKMYMGEDEGADDPKPGEEGSGAIVVETLLSMRTVASLAIEKMRMKEYITAMNREDPAATKTNILKGLATGSGQLFQFWGIGFLLWWGGYVLENFGDYSYRAFLISLFAALFSLSGLSVGLMGATDRTKAQIAAQRIFDLIDRKSSIDTLSPDGKKGT